MGQALDVRLTLTDIRLHRHPGARGLLGQSDSDGFQVNPWTERLRPGKASQVGQSTGA